VDRQDGKRLGRDDQGREVFAAGLDDTVIPHVSAQENARWAKAVEPLFD